MLNIKFKILTCLILSNSIVSFAFTTSCSSRRGQIVMSCLGDSLTYGFAPGDKRLDEPFPLLLQKQMGFKKVNNLGVNGELLSRYKHPQIKSMVDRYTQIPKESSIICVLGGTNDALNDSFIKIEECHDDPMLTTEGATEFLIRKIKENFPNSFLFFMTPTKKTIKEPNWKNYYQSDYNNVIIDTCNRMDVPVLDLYNLCDSTQDILETDGVHWSQDFVRNVITPQIVNFIEENYKFDIKKRY